MLQNNNQLFEFNPYKANKNNLIEFIKYIFYWAMVCLVRPFEAVVRHNFGERYWNPLISFFSISTYIGFTYSIFSITKINSQFYYTFNIVMLLLILNILRHHFVIILRNRRGERYHSFSSGENIGIIQKINQNEKLLDFLFGKDIIRQHTQKTIVEPFFCYAIAIILFVLASILGIIIYLVGQNAETLFVSILLDILSVFTAFVTFLAVTCLYGGYALGMKEWLVYSFERNKALDIFDSIIIGDTINQLIDNKEQKTENKGFVVRAIEIPESEKKEDINLIEILKNRYK